MTFFMHLKLVRLLKQILGIKQHLNLRRKPRKQWSMIIYSIVRDGFMGEKNLEIILCGWKRLQTTVTRRRSGHRRELYAAFAAVRSEQSLTRAWIRVAGARLNEGPDFLIFTRETSLNLYTMSVLTREKWNREETT